MVDSYGGGDDNLRSSIGASVNGKVIVIGSLLRLISHVTSHAKFLLRGKASLVSLSWPSTCHLMPFTNLEKGHSISSSLTFTVTVSFTSRS